MAAVLDFQLTAHGGQDVHVSPEWRTGSVGPGPLGWNQWPWDTPGDAVLLDPHPTRPLTPAPSREVPGGNGVFSLGQYCTGSGAGKKGWGPAAHMPINAHVHTHMHTHNLQPAHRSRHC